MVARVRAGAPAQSSTGYRRYRLVRGADHWFSPALRARHRSASSARTGLDQCDGTPDGGLDSAADHRSLSLERGSTLPDPRS